MIDSTLGGTTLLPASSGGPLSTVLVPRLTVLYHTDPRRVGARSFMNDPGGGDQVRLSRTSPAFGPPGEPDSAPLGDPHLSRQPILLRPRADGGMDLDAPEGATALTVDGEPWTGTTGWTLEELKRGVVLELGARVVLLLHSAPMQLGGELHGLGLVGHSAAMATVRERIRRVAPHDVPVLLRGGTGTGKELVASAIHAESARRAGPFVRVNMAALVPTTAASALFGHTKGAFTGAVAASGGFFGEADGGTLFLDEIGDTPADVQPALLRALESGEVQPLGSSVVSRRDVRVLAATDADLEASSRSGGFRLPLLQRLSGYVVELPPLSQRREDVGVLLFHFLRAELERAGRGDRLAVASRSPWLPARLVTLAALYDWPGNVRELRNLAQELVIDYGHREQVSREAFARIGALAASGEPNPAPVVSPREPRARRGAVDPRAIDDEQLLEALRRNDFRPEATAKALGISKTTLYALIDASSRVRKAADLDRAEIDAALQKAGGDLKQAARALEVSARGLKLRLKQLG